MLNALKLIGALGVLCGCSSTYDGEVIVRPKQPAYTFEMTVKSWVVGSGAHVVTTAKVAAVDEAHCWAIADNMERGVNAFNSGNVQPLKCLYAGDE